MEFERANKRLEVAGKLEDCCPGKQTIGGCQQLKRPLPGQSKSMSVSSGEHSQRAELSRNPRYTYLLPRDAKRTRRVSQPPRNTPHNHINTNLKHLTRLSKMDQAWDPADCKPTASHPDFVPPSAAVCQLVGQSS